MKRAIRFCCRGLVLIWLVAVLAGCEAELKSGNSHDYRRVGFTREELIDLYYRYQHEFNYVASYLSKLDIRGYSVAILNNLEQVCFDLSASLHEWERYQNYTDLGYEKDEEFERCLKTILIEGKMGYLNCGARDEILFGPNYPIVYCEYDYWGVDTSDPADAEFFDFGRIEGDWYYRGPSPDQ